MPQMLGHWSRPAIGCRTATATPPRAGFFVPAVCQSFNTNFRAGIHSAADSFWFLARGAFKLPIRPGIAYAPQCLRGFPSGSRESAEKCPLESTLTARRNR